LPFPLLWGLWVAIVDFLPMVGGALAGIPTVLFALAHSLTAGVVTAVVFVAYQQLENHVLNPLIMSKTVKVSPLLVLMSVLLGTSLGDWAGGVFGGFVAALISIPCAAALQVIVREIWRNTALSQCQATADSVALSAVSNRTCCRWRGRSPLQAIAAVAVSGDPSRRTRTMS
jgi:predicted PurR-regulated permease PerM